MTVSLMDRMNTTKEWTSLMKRPPAPAPYSTTVLTVVDVAAEIIKDAGPIYLQHVQNWSCATLPSSLTDPKKGFFCPLYCDAGVRF